MFNRTYLSSVNQGNTTNCAHIGLVSFWKSSKGSFTLLRKIRFGLWPLILITNSSFFLLFYFIDLWCRLCEWHALTHSQGHLVFTQGHSGFHLMSVIWRAGLVVSPSLGNLQEKLSSQCRFCALFKTSPKLVSLLTISFLGILGRVVSTYLLVVSHPLPPPPVSFLKYFCMLVFFFFKCDALIR